MSRSFLTAFAAMAAVLAAGCGDDGAATIDAGPSDAGLPPDDGGPIYERWRKVELPGTVCGNGSQYKLWVNRYEGATNLMVYLEGGGACWDYHTCSGSAGLVGAANTDGIPDNHIDLRGVMSPLLLRLPEETPTWDWNMVFLPYCTGDVFVGDRTVTYVDPEGAGPDLEFHHAGYSNLLAITEWLSEQFPEIPNLLVTGCSAGGVGSVAAYHTLRSRLAVGRGHVLNDSGPLFPGENHAQELYDTIRVAWNLDTVIDAELGGDPALDTDLGAVNLVLADEWPDDRFGMTLFRHDGTFPRIAYSFMGELSREEMWALWEEDVARMTEQYDSRGNMAYYLPYWRSFIDAHCSTIVKWEGSEIEELGVDGEVFVRELLGDEPLVSRVETMVEGP